MKKIGFIGATDKTDLITYVAKLLELLGKKVIVVDATILQKSKYVVPAIDPTKSYVTDFGNVDYAIGFESLANVARYLGIKYSSNMEAWNYDYMLIDIDREKMVESFEIEEAGKNYFVTSFDVYSLKRGTEILKKLTLNLNLSKILINYNISKEDEEYLNYLTVDTRVIWDELTIYVPIIDENQKLIENEQRVYNARIKKLLPGYQESIIYIVQNILGDISTSKLKKIIKE